MHKDGARIGVGLGYLVLVGLPFAGLIPSFTPSAWAQGSLTPPGGPAPMMKTLDQTEPRTPISSIPFTIAGSGSYYLTGNLTTVGGGISVQADNVTIDLMGFTISGGGTWNGIDVDPGDGIRRLGLVVRNGTIRGFGNGLYLNKVSQSVFQNLRVADNVTAGIQLRAQGGPSDDNRIEDCTVVANGGHGIFITSYTDTETCNGNIVKGGTISRNATYGVLLDGSTGGFCKGNRIEHLTVAGNGAGVYLYGTGGVCLNNVVADCVLDGNTSEGILAAAANTNRIENNTVTANGAGLHISGVGNYVANNIVRGNSDNYDFTGTNQLNLLLCEVPETLEWPCSVKFAGTLTCASADDNGITVAADDVSIDMAGHALIGPGTESREGIAQMPTIRNLRVLNGKIANWARNGYDGIYALGQNNVFENLQLVGNYYGIWCDNASVIKNCSATDNLSAGFLGRNECTISGCSSVRNCYGIEGGYGTQIIGCTVENNTAGGIRVFTNCVVAGNSCVKNGSGGGIYTIPNGGANRIKSNHVSGGDIGLSLASANNVVEDNTVLGAVLNYDLVGGNLLNLLICEVPETLRWPCSAKLAGSLVCSRTDTNGITVASDDVTIDLAGFSLTGPGHASTTYSGIRQGSTLKKLRLRNGNLGEWNVGVMAEGARNRIEKVHVEDSHAAGMITGIGNFITECSSFRTLGGETTVGFQCNTNSVVTRCHSSGNGMIGIWVQSGSVVTDNLCDDCGFAGSGSGISVQGTGSRVEGNHIHDCVHGLSCGGTGNLIVRNSAAASSHDGFEIDAGNDGAAAIHDPGAYFSSDQPWANFDRTSP